MSLNFPKKYIDVSWGSSIYYEISGGGERVWLKYYCITTYTTPLDPQLSNRGGEGHSGFGQGGG